MSLIKSIGNLIGGIGKAVGSIANIAKSLLDSPLGGLLKMAFPPLAGASAALSLVGMFGSLASGIGGGANY